ncbi:MAG: terminase large subunit domain-containing protein [Planktomarina sp.]
MVWELLCMVPKKSSKSTYTAALALTALYLNDVPNGQMLLIGPSQNISKRLYEQARDMINLDPELRDVFHLTENTKTIKHKINGTQLQVKTFDTGIVTGEIPLLTIVDELHLLGKAAKAQAVLQQIRGGGITKNRAQVMFITTQSDKRPAGVWKSELTKARDIRDGRGGSNPIMLPVLYEFPEAQQKDETFWRNKDNWSLVLPNLGFSIDEDALFNDYDNNGSASTDAERIWASQHLNIEIGIGMLDDRWIGADFWENCSDPDLTLTSLIDRSEVITAGIDPGGQDDLLALSVIGRETQTGKWLHWAQLWAHPIIFKKRPIITSQLRDFEAKHDLLIVNDLISDGYGHIANLCVRLRDTGKFAEGFCIGIDPAGKGANLAIDALEQAGFDRIKQLYGVSQGFRLSNIAASTAMLLQAGNFCHADQDIMAWCVENTRMEERANGEIPTKAESGKGKIDGLMSLFDAAELMSWHPEAAGRGLDDFLANPVMVA